MTLSRWFILIVTTFRATTSPVLPITQRRVGRSHCLVLSEAADLRLKGLCSKSPSPADRSAHGEGDGGFTSAEGLEEKNRYAGINSYSSFPQEVGMWDLKLW